MSATSSARPVRLTRFEETVHALCDGLVRRVNTLDSALAGYQAGCDAPYVVNCSGAVAAVAEWRGSVRAFGTWTGDVGRAFVRADIAEGYMMQSPGFDVEGLSRATEGEVVAGVPAGWGDPFLVVGGPAEAADDPISGDQNGPPAWLKRVGNVGQLSEVYGQLTLGYAEALAGQAEKTAVRVLANGTVEVLADGARVGRYSRLEAATRFLLPRSSSGLTATAEWLGRAGIGLQFAASGYGQWSADAGLPPVHRVGRFLTRGTIEAAGSAAGGWVGGSVGGAAAGTACGPGAPICSSVMGVIGALVGWKFSNWAIDHLPWMKKQTPKPGASDTEELADALAADASEVGEEALRTVNTSAGLVAWQETSHDPRFDARIRAVIQPIPAMGPYLFPMKPPMMEPLPPLPPGSTRDLLLRPPAPPVRPNSRYPLLFPMPNRGEISGMPTTDTTPRQPGSRP